MVRALLFAAFVCAAATALAQVGDDPEIPELARGAQRIVVGQVTRVESRFESNQFGDQLIVSDVSLDVLETLKGPDQPEVQIEVEGGTVGELTLKVSDLPVLQRGERGVFFLDGQ